MQVVCIYTTPRILAAWCYNLDMSAPQTNTKPKRKYRKITATELAKFKAAQLDQGNNTAAVRVMYGDTYIAPHARAYKLVKKSKDENTSDYINNTLQQIGQDAVNRIGKLVHSRDERVGLKASIYTIDRLEGKPMQRSESKHLSLTIETVLD